MTNDPSMAGVLEAMVTGFIVGLVAIPILAAMARSKWGDWK